MGGGIRDEYYENREVFAKCLHYSRLSFCCRLFSQSDRSTENNWLVRQLPSANNICSRKIPSSTHPMAFMAVMLSVLLTSARKATR